MLGMFFDVFSFILTHILLVVFPQVVQKQTLGEVEYLMIIWWLVVSKIFYQKLLKINIFSLSDNR